MSSADSLGQETAFYHMDGPPKTCDSYTWATEVYKCDKKTNLDPNKENIFTDYSVIQSKFSNTGL